ncbi:trifunctional class I SAM-dependent methyltransferase/NUDIX hydrolase/VOC family protein [Streptomyces sp. BA2]|uniref:trifunctional class I SAM-dependent methyltransferase/NUDIX hydrolase/VOC family protein n=1 Tax=Streptomyces sp. BA2 TaxID=436595 RepID=UPI0013292746|nr:trifunctional class I SAM-dependent methyltransferase/NUDIX hydrolase/VOC family protein [Streptomyces sp. BA2]MWA10116.1 NUDIX domain-containing protein [Streptomyces sp. BA2]
MTIDAWAERLRDWLPKTPGDVLGLGCGTGSLSLLAAEGGHRVTEVLVGDADAPPVEGRRFDVILARHVLWMLPDPEATLRHWCGLLRPGGRLVLIEGVWGTENPSGIPAARLISALTPMAAHLHSERLSGDERLWGRRVEDDRYALVAVLPAAPSRHKEVVDVHLILRRGDEVLLARRANTGYGDGLFNLPSGHVEPGEDVRTAVIREAHEEIGLTLTPADVSAELVLQHRGPGEEARIGWFFEAEYGAGGEPRNAEPDKCDELSWHRADALPDDMVAYCRAALEAWRTGERFVLHWQEEGDAVRYERGRAERATVLAPARGAHHVELWVPDFAAAEASWGWLLGELGHVREQRWEGGGSWRRGATYVVLEHSPDMRGGGHDRLRPGLNHLAFHVGTTAELDRLVAQAPGHGWSLLFPERHPFAGGEEHCAAYLEDGAGFEVELVVAGWTGDRGPS